MRRFRPKVNIKAANGQGELNARYCVMLFSLGSYYLDAKENFQAGTKFHAFRFWSSRLSTQTPSLKQPPPVHSSSIPLKVILMCKRNVLYHCFLQSFCTVRKTSEWFILFDGSVPTVWQHASLMQREIRGNQSALEWGAVCIIHFGVVAFILAFIKLWVKQFHSYPQRASQKD